MDVEMALVEQQIEGTEEAEAGKVRALVGVTAAPASSLFATLALKKAQAARSHHPADTRSTPSPGQEHSQHDNQTTSRNVS